MKKLLKPKKEDEKLLYWDWQNQLELLGKGVLTTYRDTGNTYLPTAEEKQKVPKVFGYDLWMVRIISLTNFGEKKGYMVNTEYLFKIPYYVGTGKIALREVSSPSSLKIEKLKPDNFLKVNGKSIY